MSDLRMNLSRGATAAVFALFLLALPVAALAAVDIDLAGELEGNADAIAFHADDTHDAERIPRITYNNLFALSAGNDKHCRGPPVPISYPEPPG